MSIKNTPFLFRLVSILVLLAILVGGQGVTYTVSADTDVWMSNGPVGGKINAPTILFAGTGSSSVDALNNPVSVCGSGTWTSGNLEIHHINIGQGDATLIIGPTGKSLLFDVGESNWNSSAKAQIIGPYVEAVLGCKAIDYVVISHFHLDHIGYVNYGGLWHLIETQSFTIGTTLFRDYENYLGSTSGTFDNWKTYIEGTGQAKLNPVTAVEGSSQVDLGSGITFDIITVDGNGAIIPGDFSDDPSPPSENDYSIGALISYGDFDEWIGGDLDGQYEVGGFGYTYHDIELSAAPEVGDIDVYKVNHHGSSHSSSTTFINQIDPEISVVSVGDGNTYGHPTQPIMDLLLGTSTVYLTERGETETDIGSAIVAGHIVIKTSDGSSYTVNGTSYTATEPARTDVDGDGYFAEADPDDGSSSITPAPNGGCGPIYQTCSSTCEVSAGQVLINEVLPAPSSGPEWIELYNTTNSSINIGYCYIDDIAAGSAAYQIPAGTLIPAYGFWTLDRSGYFNNSGDDARFLKDDASTVLDSYTYGSTSYDLSWYRFPNGGDWATSPTTFTTKGASNNTPFAPIVLSSTRMDANPTSATSVDFRVTFSEPVTGVDIYDFSLTATVSGASVSSVAGMGDGASYAVTVATGTGEGTIRLDVNASGTGIEDLSANPLVGGYTSGEAYTITGPPPVNDDFSGAVLITVPNNINLDTATATSDPTDPDLSTQCSISNGGQATVWYRYDPSVDSAISLDTSTSDYDTFIAVWEGANINELQFVVCNDDAGGTKQSAVAFRVTGGKTYFIEIGQP